MLGYFKIFCASFAFLVTALQSVGAQGGDGRRGRAQPQIRLPDVKEFCPVPFTTKNFDPEWEHRKGFYYNSTVYYPVMSSKSELIRITEQLYKSKNFEDLREGQLEGSCIRVTGGEDDEEGRSTSTFSGYNNQLYHKVLSPLKNAPLSWTFPPAFTGHPGGKLYISLSDNKSFTVYVICFDDNVGTFLVVSPYKRISREGIYLAKEHLKALGFKEEYMVELDHEYDCEITPIRDLPTLSRQGRQLKYASNGNDRDCGEQ